MLTINCSNCNNLIGDSFLFRFEINCDSTFQLIAEKCEKICNNLNKINNKDYTCNKCSLVLSELDLNKFIFLKHKICFNEIVYGKETKHEYNSKTDWRYFPLIKTNDFKETNESIESDIYLPNFVDLELFNIGYLIKDKPNQFEIEAYLACLIKNTILYRPYNSYLVISMIMACMKKFNQNKKCIYLSESQSAIYEIKSNLKHQTNLSIYLTNSYKEYQRKKKKIVSSDICIFNLDNFLEELCHESNIYITDISCIIFDETSLLNSNLQYFVDNFYTKVKPKPRLIGFISKPKDKDLILKLTNLIEARVYGLLDELKQDEKCLFEFSLVQPAQTNQLINLLNHFIVPFVNFLSKNQVFNLTNNVESLSSFIHHILKERNIRKQEKRFIIASLIGKIIDTIDIMKLIGTTNACEYLTFQLKNQNKQIFKKNQINSIDNLIGNLSYLYGTSKKYERLNTIINENLEKKIVICVENKQTVNCLFKLISTQFKSQNPIKLNQFNQKYFEMFESGTSKILISSCKLELKSDLVVLFDNMWTNPYVKCSKTIVISESNEKHTYETQINSELKMIELINESNQEKIDINLIDQLSELIDENHSDRLENIKFSLKVFIQESEIENLYKNLNRLEAYHYRLDLSQELFDTEQKLFSNLNVFNLVIRSAYAQHNSDDHKLFQIRTVKQILNNLQKCACQLHSKSENRSSSLNVAQLNFGNLITPFEFVKSKSEFEYQDMSIVIDTNEKHLEISNDNFKFQIAFKKVDHIICCNETHESICVYIPCRQAPLLFKSETSNLNPIHLSLFGDIEENKWIRCCSNISQKTWTFKLKFNTSDKLEVYEMFKSINGSTFLYCSIKEKELEFTLDDLRKNFNSKNDVMRYNLEVFISQNDYLLNGKIDNKFCDKLNQINDPLKLSRVLERLTQCLQNASRFETSILPLIDELIQDETKTIRIEANLDPRVVMMRRATVTPLRIIYHFAEPFFSNRVIRFYKTEKFIRLRFREEDMTKLNFGQYLTDLTKVYERITQLLKNGLYLIGHNYSFLAMSSSQLRDHGCWLCTSLDDGNSAQNIRSWMGNFKNIKCVGKYAARLGQSLSSSIETLETTKFKIIPDIKTADNKYCFTDGIGKISLKEAKKLNEKYFESNYASTFQIRFGGFKGVLAAWPNMVNEIEFRPSMQKFDSGHNRLDILNVAEFIPCYLNRQVIVILSALGIEDSVFSNLQDIMLKRMSGMLIDKTQSAVYLKNYFRNVFSFTTNSNEFNYALEPFFRDILKSIYRKHLQGLIDKSRIFVEKGCILMGCIDELGILKPNEVFIQCENRTFDDEFSIDQNNNQSKLVVLEKRVAVAKNPCMHPGDIRVLNAVDKLELRHLVNCIVFPSQGVRPITSMCSGSDLDGDLYWITWDPSLVPNDVVDPMEYDAPPAKEKDTDVNIEDIIEFFTNFIKMDQLGRLANAHQAIADQNSVLSQECIEIAQAFSYAVDFPKTGYMAQMPNSIKKLNYPDFMQKNSHSSYPSQKIIGRMFRKCKNIFQSEKINVNDFFIDLNPSFVINGHENYLPEAKDLYKQYRIELERIMLNFECKTESELFVSVCISGSANDEEKKKKKVSSWSIRKIWERFREIFFEDFEEKTLSDEMLQKASAWYVACYSERDLNRELKIISFPWIIEDVLKKFQNIQNYDMFSYSIIENYLKLNEKKRSYNAYIKIVKLKEDLSNKIKHKLILTGLEGLFMSLNDANQFQFTLLDHLIDLNSIKSVLSAEYENISFDNDSIRCQIDINDSFTIRLRDSSLNQFLYLREAIFENDILLPILFTIINFTRQDSVFVALDVPIELLLEYCINYFVENDHIKRPQVPEINLDNQDESYKWFNLYDNLQITNESVKLTGQTGQMLLNFYRDNAFQVEDIYEFKSKFNAQTIQIRNDSYELLKRYFFKVFSNLTKSVHIGSVWTLIEPQELSLNKHSKGFLNYIWKSPCVYAENSHMLLFSNMNSFYDSVKINFYSGDKIFKHNYRETFKPVLISNLKSNSNYCYEMYCAHIRDLFSKIKTYCTFNTSSFLFAFQIKFGHFYLTNISSNLMKNFHNAININKLKDDIYFRTFELSGSLLSKVKKSKMNYRETHSAFHSVINNEMNEFHSKLIDHGFYEDMNTLYNVYIDFKDEKQKKNFNYIIKYNSEFEFEKAEKLPIKWMQIDLVNSNGAKDINFCLESKRVEKIFGLDDFTKCPFNEKMVLEEKFRRFSNLHVKHNRMFVYSGDFSNWQSLLNLDDSISDKDLFKKIQIIVSNETIYSDHSDGVFQRVNNRDKVKICVNLAQNDLDQMQSQSKAYLFWIISKEFSKFIV